MPSEFTKVSIIIPVYNEEKLLGRTIESVINQTLTDIELIIVNDASTDHTEQEILKYQNRDQRIKLLRHERNVGQFLGLKHGRDAATGEYQTIIGATDTIDPRYCEKLYSRAKEVDADVLFCLVKVFSANGRLERPSDYHKKRASINFVGSDNVLKAFVDCEIADNDAAQLVKTKLWMKVSPNFPELEIIKATDTLYNFYIMQEANRVATLAEPLYTQYRNADGVSLNRDSEHLVRKLYSLLLVRKQMRSDAQRLDITKTTLYKRVGYNIFEEAKIRFDQDPFDALSEKLYNQNDKEMLFDLISLLKRFCAESWERFQYQDKNRSWLFKGLREARNLLR